MRKFILISILISGLTLTAKADTISYCHVYYNQLKKWDFAIGGGQYQLRIKSTDIKKEDTLIVHFYDDTPCPDCKSAITIELLKDLAPMTCYSGKEPNTISIPLFDFLKTKDTSGKSIFQVYFKEDISSTSRELIFSIKLE